MKLIFTLLAFSCAFVSYAQDWKLFSDSDQHHFVFNQEQEIHTVFRNSQGLNGADTLVAFNTIMVEQAVNFSGGPADCDSCYAVRGLPNILGHEVKFEANGDVWLQAPANVLIRPRAQLNDTWVFDTASAINAQVIAVQESAILGQLDSVKVALLSTGDTVKWAKSLGLFMYPASYGNSDYYHLAGLQDAGLGIHTPGFWDFFSFDVGDIFQYEFNHPDYNYEAYVDGIKKYTITSRSVSGNTVMFGYTGNVRMQYTYWWFGGGFVENYPYNGTLVYDLTDDIGILAEAVSHEDYEHLNNFNTNDNPHNSVVVRRDTGGRWQKVVGEGELYASGAGWPIGVYWPAPGYTDTFMIPDWAETGITELTDGLGVSHYYHNHNFELYYDEWLTAWRVDGDTVGSLYSDSFVGSVGENGSMLDVSVYPNPVNDYVFLELDMSTTSNAVVELVDLSGRVVFNQPLISDREQIYLTSFKAGLYIIRVSSAEGKFESRVSIVR